MCVLVAIVTKLLLILIENTETSPESAMANIALSRLQPRKQTAWKTFSSVVKLRQGSGKDRQGMAVKVKGLKASKPCLELTLKLVATFHHHPPTGHLILLS